MIISKVLPGVSRVIALRLPSIYPDHLYSRYRHFHLLITTYYQHVRSSDNCVLSSPGWRQWAGKLVADIGKAVDYRYCTWKIVEKERRKHLKCDRFTTCLFS
jgi:hypothetical protein